MPVVAKPANAVGRLIEATKLKERQPFSDLDVAARAERAGHHVTTQNLSRLRNARKPTMSEYWIRTLSAGLDVSTDRVVDAYLETFGMGSLRSSKVTIETAIGEDERLSSADKHVLMDLLRSMLKRQDAVRPLRTPRGTSQPSGETGLVLPDESSFKSTGTGVEDEVTEVPEV